MSLSINGVVKRYNKTIYFSYSDLIVGTYNWWWMFTRPLNELDRSVDSEMILSFYIFTSVGKFRKDR